jgi:NAD(P)-dependent dehydrogenase (short-subunit alcohol dehydrogenase family)
MISDTRVAVVTGASSGIGLETAKALAAAGWHVIGLGRNAERSASALAEIRAAANGNTVEMLGGDLALMSETARLSKEIAARTDHVDVLVNNAGGPTQQRIVTAEGNEATFTGNYLGHFLLTKELLPLLRASAAVRPAGTVRIINVSSAAHEFSAGLDWNDLQSLNAFDNNKAYCNAKLANLLFTRALAKRMAADGIIVQCMHPGIVATNFVKHGDESMRQVFVDYAAAVVPAAEGADTLIWLAMAAEPGKSTGGYFYQRKPAPVAPLGQDDAAAERLWTESEALVAKY